MTPKTSATEEEQTSVLALVDQLPKGGLDAVERRVLRDLITRQDEAITGDQKPEDLVARLQVAIKTDRILKAGRAMLKPIIGKLIIAIKNNNLLGKFGCTTMDEFLSEGAERVFGLPRSEAYGAKKIATVFPTMPLEDHMTLGSERVRLLSNVTSEEDPGMRKWIAQAKKMTAAAFEVYVAEQTARPASSNHRATIVIRCTKEQEKEWEDLIKDTDVHEYCDSDDPAHILLAMIQECRQSWKDSVENAKKQ